MLDLRWWSYRQMRVFISPWFHQHLSKNLGSGSTNQPNKYFRAKNWKDFKNFSLILNNNKITPINNGDTAYISSTLKV